MGADLPEPAMFLLLLPPVLEPTTLTGLHAAWGDTISQVLKEAASRSPETTQAVILDIGLACPQLYKERNQPRSTLYDSIQTLLAGVYKLICVIAARENINVEDVDGVDVRILLVAWQEGVEDIASGFPYGPVVDLATLARSGRPWQFAFGVESEIGEAMVKAFVAAKSSPSSNQVQGRKPGSTMGPQQQTRGSSDTTRTRHYHTIAGGTWDHLHIGHKLLITMTLFAADDAHDSAHRSTTFGITGDQLLVNKKHATVLENWHDRQRAVARFCHGLIDFSSPTISEQVQVKLRNDPVPNGKSVDYQYPHDFVIKCTEIQDPYGPTITDEAVTALVVSGETRSGGKAVNDKRLEKGWNAMEVFEVDVLDADMEEKQGEAAAGYDKKISSTAIREKLARKGGKM